MLRCRGNIYFKAFSLTLAGVFLFSEITLAARLDEKLVFPVVSSIPEAKPIVHKEILNISEIIKNLTDFVFPAAYAHDAVLGERVSDIADASPDAAWRKATEKLVVSDTVGTAPVNGPDTVKKEATQSAEVVDTVAKGQLGGSDTVKADSSAVSYTHLTLPTKRIV